MTPTIQLPAGLSLPKYFMPISHIYDPIKDSNSNTISSDLFNFLDAINEDITSRQYTNSILLSPPSIGIPWPSTIPGCRQSKYWKTADQMAKDMLNAIYQSFILDESQDGKLPLELQASEEEKLRKERELLATAVKSTVYMFPDASSVRLGMISQSMLLIFLHDDVVEGSPMDAGLTITDVIMNPWNESQEAEFQLPRVSIHRFLTAMTDQDPILGKNMIDGAFSWIKHTRGYRSIPGNVFESLRDYLDYRSIDIGTELLLAQAAFAADVCICDADKRPLEHLIRLYSDHISLTNDLYSFDKEYANHIQTGAILVNAVDVVHRANHISTFIAKKFVREAALITEALFTQEFRNLKQSGGLNKGQERLVDTLTLCLGGHLFYSATSGRYGGCDAACDTVCDDV